MSTDRICLGQRGRARSGDQHRAQRIERVQRPMGPAASVRFSARHFELTAGLCGQPDIAAVLRLEHTRNSLKGVRICARFEHEAIQLQPKRIELASPLRCCP